MASVFIFVVTRGENIERSVAFITEFKNSFGFVQFVAKIVLAVAFCDSGKFLSYLILLIYRLPKLQLIMAKFSG
jgi:hypothetical protein